MKSKIEHALFVLALLASVFVLAIMVRFWYNVVGETMDKNELIIIAILTIIAFRLIYTMNKMTRSRLVCKRHTWTEMEVEFEDPTYNTRILFCSTCGILPSSDIEKPQFIEIVRKWYEIIIVNTNP